MRLRNGKDMVINLPMRLRLRNVLYTKEARRMDVRVLSADPGHFSCMDMLIRTTCEGEQYGYDPKYPRTYFQIPLQRTRMQFSPCFLLQVSLCIPSCKFAFWY